MKDFETKIEERLEQKFGQHQVHEWKQHHHRNRVWTGVFLVVIGAAAMLRYTIPAPAWVFSWQMLLIVLGLFLAIRNGFRSGSGLVLVLIGGIFLCTEFFPNIIDRRMIWPMAIMAVGLFLIIKPRRRRNSFSKAIEDNSPQEALIYLDDSTGIQEDKLDCTSIFGGIKKNILSKNFLGGDVVNILGGTELNLSQADIQGTVELEVTQIFGGTKIIVPPHWQVKPEMAAIFAGIEDKRHIQSQTSDPGKVLILRGTTIFGGIEVKSF